MKVHKNVRIQYACTGGDTKPECHPELSISGKTGLLVAVSDRVAAIVPVRLEPGDKAGLIGKETLKVAQEHAPKRGDATLQCGAQRVIVPDADQDHGRPDLTGRFPEWTPLVPARGRDGEIVIRINARDIATMRKALGSDYLELRHVPPQDGEPSEPIRVDVCGVAAEPGAHGAIPAISDAEIAEQIEQAKRIAAQAEKDGGEDKDDDDDEDTPRLPFPVDGDGGVDGEAAEAQARADRIAGTIIPGARAKRSRSKGAKKATKKKARRR